MTKSRRLAGCVPIKSCFVTGTKMVLLISSKNHKNRLVLPKGGVKKGETGEEAAMRETWEESGVKGHVIHCLPCKNSSDYENDDLFCYDEEFDDNYGKEEEGGENKEREEEEEEEKKKREQETIISQQERKKNHTSSISSLEACKWYVLKVEKEEKDWPEKELRTKFWIKVSDAINLSNVKDKTKDILIKLKEYLDDEKNDNNGFKCVVI